MLVITCNFFSGLSLDNVSKYNAFWEMTRQFYSPFESAVTMKSGNADVYKHEIPGGQYTNLQFQAFSLGLGDKFEEIKLMYREANLALGDIIKVSRVSDFNVKLLLMILASMLYWDHYVFVILHRLFGTEIQISIQNSIFPAKIQISRPKLAYYSTVRLQQPTQDMSWGSNLAQI
jgi:hypothetical protein